MMAELKEVVLCLDVGTKRIGVAKSDALGIAAHVLPVIYKKSDEQALAEVLKLIHDENINKVLVGLPKNMNGTLGPSAEMAQCFARSIEKQVSIPVEMWDERLSSVEAERRLLEADMSRGKRKTKIDSLSAQIVLQSYLESKRHGKA